MHGFFHSIQNLKLKNTLKFLPIKREEPISVTTSTIGFFLLLFLWWDSVIELVDNKCWYGCCAMGEFKRYAALLQQRQPISSSNKKTYKKFMYTRPSYAYKNESILSKRNNNAVRILKVKIRPKIQFPLIDKLQNYFNILHTKLRNKQITYAN